MSQITSHIEIKADSYCTKAYIDGVQLRGLTKIEFVQSVGELPKLVFTVNALDTEFEIQGIKYSLEDIIKEKK